MYSRDGALMGCASQPDADDDSKQYNDTLFGFNDSDYVMEPDTGRSVSVAAFLLAGALCPGAPGIDN